MSARGFFYELLPLLEAARPYGYLQMSAIELAVYFETSVHHTRRYIADLKKHGLLKATTEGGYLCPVLIRRLVRGIVR